MENNVQVPKEVLEGIYRIMCNIPYSMSGYEVYETAIPNMREAQKWILNYGKENKIDMHGFDEK